jgi:hypothetical protein
MEHTEITNEMIEEVVKVYVDLGMYNGNERDESVVLEKSKSGKRGRPPLETPTFDLMGVKLIIKDNGLEGGPFNTQEEVKNWIKENYAK